jgi:long-subunit fatty acid transport protein
MGLGIHPNEHWVVALEANYIGWKNLGTSNIHYDTILPRKLELIESLSLLNSWVARVGIEGNIRRKLYGRVGGFYRTSPLSEENVAPQFFDANTIGITAGAGYRWNQRWALAISGSYSFTGERSFLFAPANFGGVIQQNTFSMGAGISLQLH